MEKVVNILFIATSLSLLLLGLTQAQVPDAEFAIDEELKLTTVVGNISDLPGLFPGTTDQTRRSLQYGILDQVSEPASLFNITKNGGVIYVAKRIDRERLCLGQSECVLKLNILVSSQVPSQFDSKVVTVFLTVNDINDNAPEFGRPEVVLEITEGNALNTVLKITGANDRDFIEQFKTQNYTLDGYSDTFELTASQTLDGSSEIDLRVLKSLDRESKDRYDFSITAYDGSSPPLSALLRVSVIVTDKNDNPPVFLNSSYAITIDGDVDQDSFILQVSATDADIGDNGLITYDFSSLQKSMLEDSFQIDSVTGEISTVGALSSNAFNFIVEAQDSGSSPLKSQTEVTVNVINTGNSAPLVTITTLGTNMEANTISITEPGGRGLFVAFVDVSDDADGVVCEISNAVFKMEPIPNKGYKISLQGTVDRETTDVYNLSVTCIDAGEPPLRSTTQFYVKILDANDNRPKFTQNKYSRTLTEGKKNGEYVLQVSASDRDIENNGEVRYSIDPNFRNLFSVHSATGVVTAIGELDREQAAVLNFEVYATDQGESPLKATSQISVFLEDINDNAPEFTKKVFRFKAREEVKGRRVINAISAQDKDAGVNGQLEYFFTGSTDGSDSMFTVESNGTIVSSRRLDREERENYTFSVMVRDKGNPPLMDSASVVVEITDINDNTPEILFPDTKIHRIPITTLPERGGLTLISAHDNDAGDNGSLKFTIVAGNEDKAFEIDQTNGEFKIARASRLKNHKNYNVEIVVSDRGNPPKANTTTLIIEVNYKNITNVRREKEEDYIIIVAVVAAVTVVFSSLIIAAICVVFQKDRNSRRKRNDNGSEAQSKTPFHNIHSHLNLSDDDKVHHVNSDNSPTNPPDFSMNDLSTTSSNPHLHHQQNHNHDGSTQNHKNSQFYQTKFSFTDGQNIPKGKAVSFSLENEECKEKSKPCFHTPQSARDTPPPPSLSTFGTSRVRPCDDDVFRQHSPGSRQVSGVTYAPVSTNGHTDDVKSDTSADTTTSDSGRGNSVDDVNFDHIIKGDISPQLNSRRHSEEPEIPPRKPFHVTDSGRSSHRVTFSKSCDQFAPSSSSSSSSSSHPSSSSSTRNPTSTNFQKFYSGGQSASAPSSKFANLGPKDSLSSSQRLHSYQPRAGSQRPSSANSNHIHHSNNNNNNHMPNPKFLKLSTFSNPSRHRNSLNSVDDDVTTTTSGSYVINPDDVKMETYVGSDIVV